MKAGLPRSVVILIVVSVIFAGLFVVGVFVGVRKAVQNRRAMQELTAVSDGIRGDLKKKLETEEDTVAGATDEAQKVQDALGKAAARMNGEAGMALRAGQRVMAAMTEYLVEYEQSYTGFTAAGGLDPSGLSSEKLITDRLALLRRFESANKGFTDFLRGAEGLFRTEIAREGLAASKLDETARGFGKGSQLEVLLAIRGTDEELCRSMAKYLQVLKDEWGKWKLDAQGELVFERASAATEFNKVGEQLQEVGNRQTELQKKMVQQAPGGVR